MTKKTPRVSERGAVRLPRVVFGSSALGNLYEAIAAERKRELVKAWIESGQVPVVIDSAGKYGAGLALEELGRRLRELEVDPSAVTIGAKLGWYRVPLRGDEPTFEPGAWVGLENDAEQRIDSEGVRACWEQGVELLGEPYRPRMASIHDPDEYLAAAGDAEDRAKRWGDILDAYRALRDIASSEAGCTLGVGAKDWRVARDIAAEVQLDWVMLANCVTMHRHEAEALAFIADLARRGVAVINSGVFNAGFLVGGAYFDYREVTIDDRPELFRWRDAFTRLCSDHGVSPAHACVQFGLSPPGVVAVALNTTDPARVQQNLRIANEALPDAFWDAAKAEGLIAADYRFLGSGSATTDRLPSAS